MSSIKKLLHSYMISCNIKELQDNNFEFTDFDTSTSIENAMPPEIPLRSQFTFISGHLIVNLCRQNDFSKITYLNLFNNCIKKIQSLD